MKNNVLVSGVVLVVVLVVGAWLYKAPTTNEEVRVGGLFGITGYVSFAGETSRDGFIMALEDLGRDPSQYPIEDSHSDLKGTVTAATKLLTTDHLNVVIGPEWAEFAEVVVPIANEHKTLFISPWMTGENARQQSPYYFSATPQERTLIRKVLGHIASSGATKIALIYSDNAYSVGHQEVIKDELSKNYPNLELVFESSPAQDTTDYRTDLVKARASGAEALYAVMATEFGADTVTRQSKELGATYSIYMPFSAISQISAEDRAKGQMDGVMYAVSKEYDRAAEFNAKYEARFGKKPAALSGATTYDMTMLVFKAIDNGAKTPEDVASYLRSVKDYRGYSNLISFGADGHVLPGPAELRQVKGDSFTVVE